MRPNPKCVPDGYSELLGIATLNVSVADLLRAVQWEPRSAGIDSLLASEAELEELLCNAQKNCLCLPSPVVASSLRFFLVHHEAINNMDQKLHILAGMLSLPFSLSGLRQFVIILQKHEPPLVCEGLRYLMWLYQHKHHKRDVLLASGILAGGHLKSMLAAAQTVHTEAYVALANRLGRPIEALRGSLAIDNSQLLDEWGSDIDDIINMLRQFRSSMNPNSE